ncbi:hypothetical protein NI25_28280 [Streptomyces sp. CCM_MD2014]|nr:hypothetical protein NI25_28280 [Streptomyces sp. CCM_MD2014]
MLQSAVGMAAYSRNDLPSTARRGNRGPAGGSAAGGERRLVPSVRLPRRGPHRRRDLGSDVGPGRPTRIRPHQTSYGSEISPP